MTLTPYRPFFTIPHEVNRLLNDMCRTNDQRAQASWRPAMDISETQTGYALTLELPGIAPEQVTLKLDQQTLTVSGEKTVNHGDASRRYYRAERYSGAFEQTFVLPSTIDTAQITATFQHGVLTITLPKAEQTTPKEISITVN